MTPPVVIAATPQDAESGGGWFAPPEFVRHAVLIAELDRQFEAEQ